MSEYTCIRCVCYTGNYVKDGICINDFLSKTWNDPSCDSFAAKFDNEIKPVRIELLKPNIHMCPKDLLGFGIVDYKVYRTKARYSTNSLRIILEANRTALSELILAVERKYHYQTVSWCDWTILEYKEKEFFRLFIDLKEPNRNPPRYQRRKKKHS